jgi:sortase A
MLLRGGSAVMLITSLLLLIDAGLTLIWQEPVSAIYTSIRQHELKGDLNALVREQPSPLEVTALGHLRSESLRIAFLARALERQAPNGGAIGKIHIPSIGADFVLIKGTTLGDLQEGPGVYSQTRFPGVPGTTAIAGHRTTYLAPFRHIDALKKGDLVEVDMPYAHFTYAVTGHEVVSPDDVRVIDEVGFTRLVLSACTPLYSAASRLIVFARLERTTPVGAARLA